MIRYTINVLFAFSLVLNALLISGCKEKHTEEEVITPAEYIKEQFNPFIFIGTARTLPALYLYSPEQQSIKEIWKPGREKILEISYSEDRSSGFFITAVRTGMEGSIPYIQGIKLYVLNNDSVITPAGVIGDALQVFARWETNSAFRVYINRMNENNPSEIRQHIQIYNSYGKLFEEQERTFDLLRQGYPRPQKDEPVLTAPGNKYALKVKTGNTDSLFFFYNSSQKRIFASATTKKINNILWSPDLMYSVIELLPDDGRDSDILVYSIKDKKIVQEWNGNTPGTLFIKNNLLVFDRGRKNKSLILFYDLNKREGIDTISMKGGCSLRTLFE